MEKTFPGNEAAYTDLLHYVRMGHPAPLILLGKRGLGKKEAALSVASHILGATKERLHATGSFFLLDKGREPVKVEDVLDILERSTVSPLGDTNLFVVCHADRMNVQAQNKLLKLLEDRNSGNIVIFLCSQDRMIGTIKSRCMTVEFHPLSDAGMEEYLAQKGIESDRGLIAHLCGNCPCLLEEIMPVYPSLRGICDEIKGIRRREDLLGVFHLLQEKDALEFYSAHAGHYDAALQMLQHLFFGALRLALRPEPGNAASGEGFGSLPGLYTIRELHAVCVSIASHQKRWLAGSYTKNDFFDLARAMIFCRGDQDITGTDRNKSITGGQHAL